MGSMLRMAVEYVEYFEYLSAPVLEQRLFIGPKLLQRRGFIFHLRAGDYCTSTV